MRILVLGCGGIGGVLAACLTRAGHDVTCITGNPAIASAIAQRGLEVLELDGTQWTIPLRAAALVNASDAAPDQRFDLCLCATQSPAMEAALRDTAPLLTDTATVVCMQNGLPEPYAEAVVGPGRVLGCVVGWGASMASPGTYKRTSTGGLQVGRAGAQGPDPAPLVALLQAASAVKIVDDLAGVRWSKLAINCATSTLGAIGGDALGPLLRIRAVRRLALEVFAELVAVATRSGVKLAPVGGTFAVQDLAITDEERRQRVGSLSLARKHAILFAVGMKYRRMRSSMLYAIEKGRPPEVDFLNGELVRRGQKLGVPTPVNSRLVEAVHAIVRGQARSSVDHLLGLAAEAARSEPVAA
jgi:2-dehydropantoate 2-reductase